MSSKQHLGGDKGQLALQVISIEPWITRRNASLIWGALALDVLHESTRSMMDPLIIQAQCELLERESTAERNLLQAQERVKAIRTMRERVLAMTGNQSHTSIGLRPRKIRMTPNASTLASPVLIQAKGLPDESEEVEKPKIHRTMPSNTRHGSGCSYSEPEITPLMTPETRPQSVPTNHHLTNTISNKYDHPLHPSSDTAPGYLKSPHSESPDTTLTRCSSKPLPDAYHVNEILDHYTSRRFSPLSRNNLSVNVLFRRIRSHMQRDKTSDEPYFISPRYTKRRG